MTSSLIIDPEIRGATSLNAFVWFGFHAYIWFGFQTDLKGLLTFQTIRKSELVAKTEFISILYKFTTDFLMDFIVDFIVNLRLDFFVDFIVNFMVDFPFFPHMFQDEL